MPDGEDAPARVAVRGGVARELLEVVALEREPRLLAEPAGRGVEQIFVGEDEPSRQAPAAGERWGVATDQERAQLRVTHREDHQVDGDGEEVSTHP